MKKWLLCILGIIFIALLIYLFKFRTISIDEEEIPLALLEYSQLNHLEEYTLVWHDEFDESKLDKKRWNYRFLGKRREAINSKKAVEVNENGELVITTYIDKNEKIHTGMIGTQNLFNKKYGYFEAKIKLQGSNGNWSAFWLQSPKIGKYIGDISKAGAEIDIYEVFNVNDNNVQHAVHVNGYGENHEMDKWITATDYMTSSDSGYHIYGLEWTESYYKFYIDNVLVAETTEKISKTEQYIILSMEVGKNQKEYIEKKNGFSDQLIVDYVRVYDKILE